MNRLVESLTLPASNQPTLSTSTPLRLDTPHDKPPHRLMVPLHYEKNYSYPLLVWLHGPEDNENQIRRVLPHVSLRNYVGVGPRATGGENSFADEALEHEATGQEFGFLWEQTEAGIAQAEHRVLDCVEAASDRCNVHPDRVFIGGYLGGGSMAVRLAIRMPHVFAGAISINGAFPREYAPLLNVDRARGLPLLFCQGRDASELTEDQLCRDLRLLHSAGMAMAIRQYPCGDELTTQMLSDIDSWMMERVTSDTPAC